MAGPSGRSLAPLTSPPLIDRLRREPFRFESGQALRILSAPGGPAAASRIRYRSTFDLAFPASEVERVFLPASGRPEMVVNFFGLGGAIGPLPVPFTESINDSERRGELAPRDFVDIFNGRLVESALELDRLFRPVLQPGQAQASNLAGQLYAMLGLATPEITAAIPRLAPALLPLAALVHQRPMSAHAVERAVASHFRLPVRVRQFQGAWLDIPKDQRTTIGGGGGNRRLGVDAVVGRRAWDQSAGIELVLGPIPYSRALSLIPGAKDHRELAQLLEFMLGDEVRVTARLLVSRAAVPPVRLRGCSRPPGGPSSSVSETRRREPGPRLGWTSWLAGGPRLGDGGLRLGRTSWLLRNSGPGRPGAGRARVALSRFEVLPRRPDPPRAA